MLATVAPVWGCKQDRATDTKPYRMIHSPSNPSPNLHSLERRVATIAVSILYRKENILPSAIYTMTRNMGTWIILLILSAVSSGVSAWDVSAKSTAGRRLLKNAQKVEYNESGDLVVADRRLEDQQQAEDDDDDSWVAHMSLKFDACYNTVILSENGGQNGQSPIVNQGVVTFRLCQSYNCDKCSEGGIYAIDLAEFVSAYSAAKMEENQYTCQSMLQSCGCYNADDEETCAYKCWQKHGLEYCFYDDNFQFENYLECARKYCLRSFVA